jgi:hypothetical protein
LLFLFASTLPQPFRILLYLVASSSPVPVSIALTVSLAIAPTLTSPASLVFFRTIVVTTAPALELLPASASAARRTIGTIGVSLLRELVPVAIAAKASIKVFLAQTLATLDVCPSFSLFLSNTSAVCEVLQRILDSFAVARPTLAAALLGGEPVAEMIAIYGGDSALL